MYPCFNVMFIYLKNRKTKSDNLVANNIKISWKMKSNDWLIIEKNVKYGKQKYFTNKD